MSTDIWTGIATIIALLVGPILAVLVTRIIDKRRAETQRKWDIFRTLMRYRRVLTNVEFVGALNLVEIEFADHPAVMTALKALIKGYYTPAPTATDEAAVKKWADDLDVMRVQLLDAIAKSLNIKVQQLDILKGGYAPKGWFDVEEEQRQLRQLLAEIMKGNRGFPVEIVQPKGTGAGKP